MYTDNKQEMFYKHKVFSLTFFLPLVSYEHVGCFNDARDRALPKYLGNIETIKDCFLKAKKNNFKVSTP